MSVDNNLPVPNGNRKWATPFMIIGYLTALIGSVAGGAYGTANYLGHRDTQLYNIEYRLGMMEKWRDGDIMVQQTAKNSLDRKLDDISKTLNCIQILQANRNARCY